MSATVSLHSAKTNLPLLKLAGNQLPQTRDSDALGLEELATKWNTTMEEVRTRGSLPLDSASLNTMDERTFSKHL
jgi:hypothetical protein